MRDYAELVKALRYCSEQDNCGSRCPKFDRGEKCRDEIETEAADAIEELLAAVPKQGEWEHQELAPTNWTFCSVCGRQRSKKYKWYYCPNCGARMTRAEAEKAMEVSG